MLILLAFNTRVLDGEVYAPNLLALSSEHGAYISETVDIISYTVSTTSEHPLLVACYTEGTMAPIVPPEAAPLVDRPTT